MNAAVLKAKIEDAKRRLSSAEGEMERALHEVGPEGRADKRIISAAVSTALAEMKVARQELVALDQVIANE